MKKMYFGKQRGHSAFYAVGFESKKEYDLFTKYMEDTFGLEFSYGVPELFEDGIYDAVSYPIEDMAEKKNFESCYRETKSWVKQHIN